MKKIDGSILIKEYRLHLNNLTNELNAGHSLHDILTGIEDKKLELFEREVFNEFANELTWIEEAYDRSVSDGDNEITEWFNLNNAYDFIYDLHSTKHDDYINWYMDHEADKVPLIYDIIKHYCNAVASDALYQYDEEYQEVASGAHDILVDKGVIK